MSQDKDKQSNQDEMGDDQELSALYRDASAETVPTHLDDAILAAARRQVNSQPRQARSPFTSGWTRPLSIAAVMVLCVTLVISVQENVDRESAEQFSDYAKELQQVNVPSRAPAGKVNEERFEVQSKVHSADIISEKSSKAETLPAMSMPTRKEQKTNRQMMNKVETLSENVQLLEPAFAPAPQSIPAQKRRLVKKEIEVSDYAGRASTMRNDDRDNSAKAKSAAALSTGESEDVSFVAREMDMDFAGLVSADESLDPEQRLLTIQSLWEKGRHEDAEQQLSSFIEQYPEFDFNSVRPTLNAELMNLAARLLRNRQEKSLRSGP